MTDFDPTKFTMKEYDFRKNSWREVKPYMLFKTQNRYIFDFLDENNYPITVVTDLQGNVIEAKRKEN